MSDWADQLNRMKLGEFSRFYSNLKAPDINSLEGYYQGFFVGPGWLRQLAGPMLVITGLGGWWGKRFNGDGTAINLVRRQEKLEAIFPMHLVRLPSQIDGEPGVALYYESKNPFPWPLFADELRLICNGTFLGMTYVKVKMLQGLMLPFLLEHRENFNGL